MSGLLDAAVGLTLALLSLALVVAFVRLARGPGLADRIVALDVIAATVVAVAITCAIDTGLSVFVDVALAVALVGFLGTLALSRAVETGGDA